ncbi:MAG: HPr family phosphocarrier protein [Lachnospiraceae bacterium]|nr:HPr family phosphocarrier protein [Lachnospiraceae bacterium]MDD6034672.1 HPr family phosphocarrier protein [Lachnospiraceae bacterium]
MQEVQISLNSIEDVKQFVQTLTMFDGDFEVISGKYIVDAKSILGLFSIDLSKPVTLRIDVDETKMEKVLKAISIYRVN